MLCHIMNIGDPQEAFPLAPDVLFVYNHLILVGIKTFLLLQCKIVFFPNSLVFCNDACENFLQAWVSKLAFISDDPFDVAVCEEAIFYFVHVIVVLILVVQFIDQCREVELASVATVRSFASFLRLQLLDLHQTFQLIL